MLFKTNVKNIQLEDTGYLKIHNFPASPNTYSYMTRTYRQYEENKYGYKEIDGEPIYFNDMTSEQVSLAIIMGTAQNTLNNLCKREDYLIPINNF